MLPSIDSLRCFRAAARLLNFRAAARSVALTPAAFGQRIKQLEEQLGAALFKRTTRSVRLTEAGLALLPSAERCLQSAEECARLATSGGRLSRIDLTIGTRHELGVNWLLPQIDALQTTFPYLRANLYFGSSADLLLRVRTMEIDCAVTSSLLADPKLVGLRLQREDYVFVGSRALLAKRPLQKFEQAAHHTLIDYDPSLPLYRYFREAIGGDKLRFDHLTTFGTIEAIRQRVLAGAGVGVLPLYLVEPDLRAKRVVRLFPKIALPHDFFRLVIRVDDPRRTIFEALAEELLKSPLR